VREVESVDVPVLLLCAEDSEVTLVQLVDALNRSGHPPELIAGVEHDTALLTSAADRTRGPGLFVLCQSEDLDRSQVLKLTGLFSARKGPQHQLLVVELDETQPLESLPTIEAALEAVGRGETVAPAPDDDAERVPTRDVVVMPGESNARAVSLAVDRGALELNTEARPQPVTPGDPQRDDEDAKAQEQAEALARALHEEMAAAEAALDRRRSARSGTGSIVDQLDFGDGVPGVPQEIAADPHASTRPLELDQPIELGLDGAPPAAAAPEPEPEPDPHPDREQDEESEPAREQEADDDAELGALSSSLANVRVADPLAASVGVPDTIQTELTPTDTRPRRREPLPPADTATPARRESRSGWLLGLVGAATLGGLALFVVKGGAEAEGAQATSQAAGVVSAPAPERSAPAKASPRPVPAKPPKKTAAPPQAPKPEVESPKPAPSVAPTPAVDTSAPPPAAAPKPEVAKPEAPTPEPLAAPAPAEPPTPPEPAAVASAVPPPPSDSEALRVDQAIRDGKVRALDSLLVARAGTKSVEWSQAKSACRRKRVAGLPGWRLPSRKELSRLRRARMLESGTFWSRDRGEHDDDAYAVDSGNGASNLYLKVEPAAQVQCVRKR